MADLTFQSQVMCLLALWLFGNISLSVYKMQVLMLPVVLQMLSVFRRSWSLLSSSCSVLLLAAGAAYAAEEAVDHLDGTEHGRNATGHQQGGEESHVELHHVLGILTPLPHVCVLQVAPITVHEGTRPNWDELGADIAYGSIGQAQACHGHTVDGSRYTHCSKANGQEHPTTVGTAPISAAGQVDVNGRNKDHDSSSQKASHILDLRRDRGYGLAVFRHIFGVPVGEEQNDVADDRHRGQHVQRDGDDLGALSRAHDASRWCVCTSTG